jgi:CshA-type fibril repeat protein
VVTFTVAPLANNDVKPGQRARDGGQPGRSGNDVASTGRTLDPSSVDLDPTTPGQQTTLTVSGEGVWTVDSSGEVIFTPESGYFLDPTPITYTIADDQGNLSNVATITVDYVPVASDDVSTGNPIGQPVTVDVLANDTTGRHAGSGHGADRGDGQPRRRVGGSERRHLDGQPDDRCDHLHAGNRLHGRPDADRVHGAGRQGNTSDPAEVVVTFTVAPLANNDVNLGNVPGTSVSLVVPATTWPRPAARST